MATALAVQPKKTLIERLEERETLLSVNDVAELLNESVWATYRRVRAGKIPCIKLRYGTKFDPTEIAAWLKEHHVG